MKLKFVGDVHTNIVSYSFEILFSYMRIRHPMHARKETVAGVVN